MLGLAALSALPLSAVRPTVFPTIINVGVLAVTAALQSVNINAIENISIGILNVAASLKTVNINAVENISISILAVDATLKDVNINMEENINISKLAVSSTLLQQIGVLDGNRDPLIIITE